MACCDVKQPLSGYSQFSELTLQLADKCYEGNSEGYELSNS